MFPSILKSAPTFVFKLGLAVIGITFNHVVIDNSPAQAANLITNGSFEIGTDPGESFVTLEAYSNAIAGWMTTGSINYVFDWQASEGSRSVELNGLSPGGVEQFFNTTLGNYYLVEFDLAGNPNSEPLVKSMMVRAANQSAIFEFGITDKTTANMGWQRQSWQFMARSNITKLEIFSNMAGVSGPMIDNVSVTEIIPEIIFDIPEYELLLPTSESEEVTVVFQGEPESIPEPGISPFLFVGTLASFGLFSRRYYN